MAWFAVSSLMRTVELEFLSPNPHVVLDDTNAAEALHGRLRELVDFLEKSENQFNAEDVAMQDWKARLKDVALRIEDEIESKVIDSYSGGQSTSTIAESFHSTLEYAIEELTKCVKEDLQVNDSLSSRERIESSSSSSLPTASKLQSTMVGRTAELERIKRLLLKDKSEERLVVTVVGMAGIEESWDLFLQKIHHARLSSEVEAIWRHIVNYFKGLPFTIVIAAGLARAINESLWISKEIDRIFYERMCFDLVQDISKILILSYNNLPNFLKICFLYLGIFPESINIPVKKLIKLCIAEGFVKVEGQRSLEEVAEGFLKDLVSRNLVLIDKISLDGKIKTCKVHGIVHDFCKRKAMEEDLLHVVDGHFGHLHTYHWVSIETMNVSPDDISNRSRSILSVCHNRVDWFTNFKMLRVLDLSSIFCRGLDLICDGLVLLRYLALTIDIVYGGVVEMRILEKSFNLQILVLLTLEERQKSFPIKLSQIWMPMLRHLQFSTVLMLDPPSAVQESLQTIYWLRPSQCTKNVFSRIPNVKVMGIFVPWRWEEIVVVVSPLLDDLINLRKLEKLKINSHLDDPIILPDASAFPEKLKMLTLKGTLVPWDAMEVVCMLPNLEVLKLKSGACIGQHWKLSGDWFPKLKSLLIQEIMELKQWTATDGAFPILERLIIKHCLRLKNIPSTFDELYSLQLIELHGCHSLLVHSANQIQQQQEELLGNDGLVVHNFNTQLKYKANYHDSSYFARQVQEEEDSKLTNDDFFNCFEDDFDNNDIN
ncbi:putative late blight resistance protein homolog R1B-12 isoform X2 [Ipomoea triloba]|uniref:putative late blight resistance protein homolog R1B-12 isoform X2 n=1 Tax=Ipomoea triloba TaxID=35885 RepID=UPI00125DA089|nr:putative late blight resistance protein homolog R1B-12 isoform X2 [Ipomoea triloba]